MKRGFRFLTNIMGTVAIFAFMWLLQSIPVNFEFLNVFDKVLGEFRLSDLYFLNIRDKSQILMDTNVVIVNIGELNREGIAAEIEILSQHKPKVIGLDILLPDHKSAEIDSIFEATVKKAGNVVLASRLYVGSADKNGKIVFDSLSLPMEDFVPHVETAYVNIITEEEGATNDDFATVRVFSPKEKVGKNHQELAFSVKLAQKLAPDKVDAFLARNKDIETIYYKGNWDKYTILDVEDVFSENFDPSLIKDKIIILGYLGAEYRSPTWSGDRFYTPLNPNQVGRTFPDMYGVVIHANIISMITDQNYINELDSWVGIALAIFLCFLNVVLFTNIYYSPRFATWYDVLTKGFQMVELIIIVFILIWAIAEYHLIIDSTVAIFAILLSGDVLEVFLAFWANVFFSKKRRKGIK
jgi:CHASE2 domain-containing sensor protein